MTITSKFSLALLADNSCAVLVFNTDLADAVLNFPLSVNSEEETQASSCANKSSISTGLPLAWRLGLQPEKNKLVFFGKKRFFSRKKHSLKKTGQNFVFFHF